MNISIIGYGKMGKTVEKIARNRGHNISLCYDHTPSPNLLKNTDIVIEFSQPNSVVKNIIICMENNIPMVCGTTGWLDKLEYIKKMCIEKKGAFLHSSNFSISMNIFSAINRKLSKLLRAYSNQYNIIIEEVHHKKKLDNPSGTSISLANDIINNNMKDTWVLGEGNKKNIISIISKRLSDVIGTHSVIFKSKIDDIKIEHKAHNRNGFALGAVIAAEWIRNKKGFFSMRDVLDI
ncbi:4-hydroxy-tetrahydrodipicolinate reductase [Blattabacterium cuenoti]|uniref:4-hydroxy-tetrahydrodipicolinate reductase n=1 Tax=Blattabacterium cuenoti TaxID=1653831 RepID=UPI00163C1641|nr:4-hydroxy-tetrahydrodipicolinate reductase [Blattabacterium cuenoti]